MTEIRSPLRAVVKRRLIGAVVICGLMNSGCSSTNQLAAPGNFFSRNQPRQTVQSVQDLRTAQLPAQNTTNQLSANSNRTSLPTQPTQTIKLLARPIVKTVSYTEPTVAGPSNAGITQSPIVEGAAAGTTGFAEVNQQPVRRVPAQLAGRHRTAQQFPPESEGCSGCPSCSSGIEGGCEECQPALPGQRAFDAQEFICDGGDQEPATIVRDDWSNAGVGTTDTVMYYETLGGKVCVIPSNRTCVYAPRFGSVRQITGAVLADSTLAVGRVHAPVPAHGLGEVNGPNNLAATSKIVGRRDVQLLDRLVDQRRGVLVDSVVPPTPVGGKVAAEVAADRATAGVALSREWADLIQDRIEVVTLINPEGLHVEIGNQAAVAVLDTKSASEYYLYETPDGCTIRLTKTASHQIAHSGDRIRFTIRFENVGTQKLGNAVVLDSLSPRLNYIEGSQLSSVDANFSMEPNDAGSKTLRWDIKSPIASRQTGVITFDCEVR
jgi:uncharacterized repeat protein (TIGR01451 family)